MTNPLCGTPHYRYPETLCTEPAHHYIPDRDPHAGPLIINSREIGGAAWDEPKEQHMSDRHTVDSITSDALDQLYADRDQATQLAADRADQIKHLRDRWASCRERLAEQETETMRQLERAETSEQRLEHAEEELRHRTETATTAPGADALRADQAEASIERVRHIANLIDAGAPWTASHHDTANRIREALDGQP